MSGWRYPLRGKKFTPLPPPIEIAPVREVPPVHEPAPPQPENALQRESQLLYFQELQGLLKQKEQRRDELAQQVRYAKETHKAKLASKRALLEKQASTWEATIARLRTEVRTMEGKYQDRVKEFNEDRLVRERESLKTQIEQMHSDFKVGTEALGAIAKLFQYSVITKADLDLVLSTVHGDGEIAERVCRLIEAMEMYLSR